MLCYQLSTGSSTAFSCSYWLPPTSAGVKQDLKLAAEHFHAAAEDHEALSLANLGYMYLNGLGESIVLYVLEWQCSPFYMFPVPRFQSMLKLCEETLDLYVAIKLDMRVLSIGLARRS